MTSLIGAHGSRLPLPNSAGPAGIVRAICLAGTTAIALALALPAMAQTAQQGSVTEPDTSPPAAAEGISEPTSPPAGMPQGDATGEDSEAGSGTAGLAATAESGEGDEQPIPFEGQVVAQEDGTFAISNLVGTEVKDRDGEPIGKVRDVLLSDEGQLDGIVVAIGGFLGFGEKQVGIDIARAHMVETDRGKMSVLLDVGLAELERAPAFVSLEAQRLAAEEEAARQAAEQQLQTTTGGATAPAPTQ